MNTPDQNKKDQKEKSFPGYPSYPASEDVTNQNERIDYGSLHRTGSNSPTREGVEERATDVPRPRNASDEINPDTDVTSEDIAMLSASDQNRDMDDPDMDEPLLDTTDEDGDPLNEVQSTYNEAGTDLDVPGSETDDGNEDIGEEDEENNYYSLGQDRLPNIDDGENVTNR
jgi:hypothetical protein